MIINPEFHRNLWLELSKQRLIATPMVIAAILYLCYLIKTVSIQEAAYFIFLFYLFLWGTKAACESIPDEIKNKTWDNQRLSALSPWTLAWGKLLGATSYAWYGALLALIPYTILLLRVQSPTIVALQLATLILGGLFAHSVAFLSSMVALQWESHTKIKTFFYFLTGLFISWFLTSLTLGALAAGPLLVYQWFHFSLEAFWFNFASLCLFLLWTLIGIYRNMRHSLQYPSLPWVWFSFTLFCMIYFSGFFFFSKAHFKAHFFEQYNINAYIPQYVAFSVAVFLCYLALFSEKLNIVTYKKVIHNIKKPKSFPRWIACAILILLMGAWIAFLPTIEIEKIKLIPAIFIIASILFITRDILIIHYFQFADRPQHALFTAAFYLAIVYLLAPALVGALTHSGLMAFFFPIIGENSSLAILAPGLEVLFMIWMLQKRWVAQKP